MKLKREVVGLLIGNQGGAEGGSTCVKYNRRLRSKQYHSKCGYMYVETCVERDMFDMYGDGGGCRIMAAVGLSASSNSSALSMLAYTSPYCGKNSLIICPGGESRACLTCLKGN